MSTAHPPSALEGPANDPDARLAQLLTRINKLTGAPPAAAGGSAAPAGSGGAAAAGAGAGSTSAPIPHAPDTWVPLAPKTLEETGFTDAEVEALALKFLLARGSATGRKVAEQLRFPFAILEDLLRVMKQEQLVVYRASAQMNDYVYQLTDLGRERAKRYSLDCTYYGSMPVTLDEYVASVKAQSLTSQHPTREDLMRAFDGLLINPRMFARLGPAINSGKGLFLYGYPGNGKTSIAKRITRTFGTTIWVPRAIGVDGDMIRLFDPMNHEEAPLPANDGLLKDDRIDHRWVRIKRPTIVVGGELTMEHLEVSTNRATGISEAPLQMKSNCGTLVIDDFGRQRISTDELLNRWIVPLEERIDFLNVPSGKTIQVPFDQLIVFSTNLEPKDLVDEAFLRRIPYKIEVIDPSEIEFRQLFRMVSQQLGFAYDDAAISYLVAKHYKATGRHFRACHPRDLLLQVRNHCLYAQQPLEMTPQNFDFAVENYFAVM